MGTTDYADYTDFKQLAVKKIRGNSCNSWAKILKKERYYGCNQ
jgi:hypothetical protein